MLIGGHIVPRCYSHCQRPADLNGGRMVVDSRTERIRLRGAVCRLGFSRKMSLDTFQCARCFGEATTGLECVPSPLHLFQNVVGFGCPNIRLGLAVVSGNVALDGLLEFPNIVKDTAAHAL